MAGDTPTIGIITALPLEQAAMVALLDSETSTSIEGANTYWPVTFGTLPAADGEHRVVAHTALGNNNAATCATFLLSHFDQLGAIFMVGIAGGVPCPIPKKDHRHVRLGDIVVPTATAWCSTISSRPKCCPTSRMPASPTATCRARPALSCCATFGSSK